MSPRLCSLVVAAAALAGAALSVPPSVGSAHAAGADERSDYTFAVIGDVPYGDDQVAAFPGWIRQINADPGVRSVVHLGDIKNGSTVCSDEYFAAIRGDFDTFEDPLVYTPGDNEWTDCHRTNNGGYDPLERLAKVRGVFFDRPGVTMGRKTLNVEPQAGRGFPENVTYHRAELTFAAAHVVGSNNDLAPWSGIGNTEATPEQIAEEEARTRANIDLLHRAFVEAKERGDRGVVVMQQADMFNPTVTPTWDDISAFKPYVQALVDESSDFDSPVYLLDGDSHVFNVDHPLAQGSPWLSTYGVTGSVDGLTRITVDGSANNHDWLKIRVNRPGSQQLLSWTQVPYAG